MFLCSGLSVCFPGSVHKWAQTFSIFLLVRIRQVLSEVDTDAEEVICLTFSAYVVTSNWSISVLLF